MNLTDKQEAFAIEYVMNGGNATKAYELVYNSEKMAKPTIWARASELRNSSKVSVRIKELRLMTFGNDILTIEERKKILTDLSINGDTKAIDLLNKMDGIYNDKPKEEEKPLRIIIERISNS